MGEPAETLICRQIGSELMVRDSLHGRVVFLNNTAAEVWRLTAETDDADQIAQALQSGYTGAEAKPVREQVSACLRQLSDLGLLGRGCPSIPEEATP